MPRRFINLFKQDMTVALRNKFQYVLLFIAVLIIVIVNFLIPHKVKLTPNEVFFDNSTDKVLEAYLIKQRIDENRIFHSREEIEGELKRNKNAIGIIMEGTVEDARFTVLHQGTESKEILNLLDATIEGTLDVLTNSERNTNHRIEYLRPKSEPIPFNKSVIPVLMITEVVMLGFMLIAVMVFQEKQEGSIRAYRVSPGKTLEYILSKVAVNVILALIPGIMILLFTMGFKINYLNALLLIILASSLMTLLGLSVSVFFKNFQQFLFVGILIILIIGVPMMSYLLPSFAPSYITWIPSYPVLFGLREILFPTGKAHFLISLDIVLAVECMILLVTSFYAVRRNLMREGK